MVYLVDDNADLNEGNDVVHDHSDGGVLSGIAAIVF